MAEFTQKMNEVNVSRESLNKLVMNYLVIEGYKDAAEEFQRESATPPGTDLESITDRMAIRNAVQEGNVSGAISRVNGLSPELLDTEPALHFRVRKQEFIELVRKGDVEAALTFAEEQLAPAGEEDGDLLEEMENVMALLAFPEPEQSPLKHLLDPAHRQKTASELNAAILAMQGQEKESKLPILLKLLVWAQAKLEERRSVPSRMPWLEGGEDQ